jgi:hypothetical protein
VSVAVDCSAPSNAFDDSAAVAHDSPPTGISVLTNDNDGGDGGPMTITSSTQPSHGAVVITGSGTGLTYEPDPGYCNNGSPTDDFDYTLNGASTATVSITVACALVPTTTTPQQLVTPPQAKKCKKGFKKVRGKCKKKTHKRAK